MKDEKPHHALQDVVGEGDAPHRRQRPTHPRQPAVLADDGQQRGIAKRHEHAADVTGEDGSTGCPLQSEAARLHGHLEGIDGQTNAQPNNGHALVEAQAALALQKAGLVQRHAQQHACQSIPKQKHRIEGVQVEDDPRIGHEGFGVGALKRQRLVGQFLRRGIERAEIFPVHLQRRQVFGADGLAGVHPRLYGRRFARQRHKKHEHEDVERE